MFLDHDIVVDRYGRVYVVLGNYHPHGMVYAYLKYVPASGGVWQPALEKGWCLFREGVERLLCRQRA